MSELLLDPGFVTDEMVAIFSPRARVRGLLAFEAALARAEARLGLVPAEAAEAIARACEGLELDADALLRRGWELGTPLLPLLERLRAILPRAHADHLHRGATTQDAVDTASALELRAGLAELAGQVATVARLLRPLVHAHRETPSAGRTLLQRGQPTSFGLTAARWLTSFVGAAEELARARTELPVQLGGAVGALDGLDGRGLDVMVALADELGLRAPILPWHADRTPIARALHALALTVRAAVKLAGDLVLLSQSEIAEVRMRAGGSSSMPDKRNPIDAIRAVAAGEAALRLAAAATTGRTHELERAAGGWHMEWLLVPLAFYASGAALGALHGALATLEVDAARMRANAGGDVPASTGALIDRALAAADACWGADT